MITMFNMGKNTRKLSKAERTELLRCIDEYSSTPDGAWLQDVEYHKTTYMWKEDLKDTDVQAIRPFFGNTVYLQPNTASDLFWCRIMAAPAIHELRHMWQKQRNGVVVHAVRSVFGRIVHAISPSKYETVPLEEDAFTQQDKALNFILTNIK